MLILGRGSNTILEETNGGREGARKKQPVQKQRRRPDSLPVRRSGSQRTRGKRGRFFQISPWIRDRFPVMDHACCGRTTTPGRGMRHFAWWPPQNTRRKKTYWQTQRAASWLFPFLLVAGWWKLELSIRLRRPPCLNYDQWVKNVKVFHYRCLIGTELPLSWSLVSAYERLRICLLLLYLHFQRIWGCKRIWCITRPFI
jgi:hypothetical protein